MLSGNHGPSGEGITLVSVILVNWNSLDDTLDCLESLREVQYGNMHIIVVDNGSRDDQATTIRQRFPEVHVHSAGRNLGYTGGNNLGIRLGLERGAEYVVCLNNDTTVAPDFLSQMVAAMDANPTAGLATAAIYEAHRPDVLAGLGCELHFERMICGEPVRQLPPSAAVLAVNVPYAEGCALMMRREVAEQTCGFDDLFFAYFEDADLCLRAKALRWSSLAVPAAHVWHKVENKPTGASSTTACFYSARNAWLLARRHASPEDRKLFYRNYPAQISSLLLGLFRPPASVEPAGTNSEHARRMALVLGAAAGWLGFTGNRRARSWSVLEGMLRTGLWLFLHLCSPLAFLAFRLRRRLS